MSRFALADTTGANKLLEGVPSTTFVSSLTSLSGNCSNKDVPNTAVAAS